MRMGRLRRLTKQWTHFWQVTGKNKPCCHTPQRLAGQLPTCQLQSPDCASLSTAVRLHTPNPAQPRSGAVPIKPLEKIHSVLPFFQLAPCWLQLASATPSSAERWSVQKAPSTKRAPFLKAEGWAISKCCSTSWILPETWLLFSNHPCTPWLRLHTRMCMHTNTHTHTHIHTRLHTAKEGGRNTSCLRYSSSESIWTDQVHSGTCRMAQSQMVAE